MPLTIEAPSPVDAKLQKRLFTAPRTIDSFFKAPAALPTSMQRDLVMLKDQGHQAKVTPTAKPAKRGNAQARPMKSKRPKKQPKQASIANFFSKPKRV